MSGLNPYGLRIASHYSRKVIRMELQSPVRPYLFLKLNATITKHNTNNTNDNASVENEFACMKNRTSASIADFPNRQRLGLFRNTLIITPFDNVPRIAKGIG